MIKIYLLIFLFILMSGCKTREREAITIKSLTVSPAQKMPHISFSELFTHDELIPLETTDFCLIGHINKIIPKNDRFYIHDDIAKCVFVFDKQGKFITKIGSVGRGPGEYIELNNIYMDNEQDYLIFDCFHKYMIFDLKTNNLLSEKSYSLQGYEQRMYLGNETFTTYCDNFIDENRKDNLVIEQKGDLVNSYFPIKKDLQSYTYRNEHVFFENFNGKKYFIPPYNDTIFTFNKENIKSYLYIDYGKNKLPEHFFHNIPNNQKTEQLLRSSYCHSLDNFIDNDNYTYFRFCTERQTILNYYLSKKENKSYIFSYVEADSNGFCPILAYNVFDNDNSLIVPAEIGLLKSLLSQANKNEKTEASPANKKQNDIFKKIELYTQNEDNNPVLFVLQLK